MAIESSITQLVEDFILNLEEKYGVQIQAIGYDRWNALSTAQKLEKAGYNLVEIRQHSSVLPSTDKIIKREDIEQRVCIHTEQFA